MNFSIRAITKHKTYQRNFLIWVAYVRKVSQKIGETERRTCPLEACEAAPFDTHDAMLQHVYTCPHLARGSYKCCECGKSERISKIHTDGCHELRRFSTVRNSLRRAKRLLSSHGPKTRNASECAPNKQMISEKIAVLPTQTDSYNTRPSDLHPACTELEAFWTPEIHELEMAMSAACGNSLIFDLPQITCSELSARHDHAQVSEDHQPEMEHAPVELSTGYNSTWKPGSLRRTRVNKILDSPSHSAMVFLLAHLMFNKTGLKITSRSLVVIPRCLMALDLLKSVLRCLLFLGMTILPASLCQVQLAEQIQIYRQCHPVLSTHQEIPQCLVFRHSASNQKITKSRLSVFLRNQG
jgi:hypothetical protein